MSRPRPRLPRKAATRPSSNARLQFRLLGDSWRGVWECLPNSGFFWSSFGEDSGDRVLGSFLVSGVHGLGLGPQDAFARDQLFGVCASRSVCSQLSLLSLFQEPELASSKLATAWALTEGPGPCLRQGLLFSLFLRFTSTTRSPGGLRGLRLQTFAGHLLLC